MKVLRKVITWGVTSNKHMEIVDEVLELKIERVTQG
jgi:hypothetical protein